MDRMPANGYAKAFNVLFIVEAALKIVSLGFWLETPQGYLRDSWNAMDFTIVLVSVLDMADLEGGDHEHD